MVYVGFVFLAVTLVLHFYWWRDMAARRRYRDAGYVTFGLYFGAQTLDFYQRHSFDWVVAISAVAAVCLVVSGIWRLWRGKPRESHPPPEDASL